MIQIFIKNIENCLSQISYIESVPLVQPFKKKDGDKTLIFPVACDTTEDECRNGPFAVLLPSANKQSLFFLTQLSNLTTTIGKGGKRGAYRGRFALSGWINTKLFGAGCTDAGLICIHVLRELEKCKKGGSVLEPFPYSFKVLNLQQSIRDPFSGYSTQLFECFKLYPYDTFVLEFDFEVSFNYSCIPDFEPGEPNLC